MIHLLALLLATTTPTAQPCAAGAPRAASALTTADRALAARDYRAADAALNGGIDALGRHYAAPPTADDTGMRLVLAESQRRKGQAKQALALKRRVLAERLELCRGRAAAPTR